MRLALGEFEERHGISQGVAQEPLRTEDRIREGYREWRFLAPKIPPLQPPITFDPDQWSYWSVMPFQQPGPVLQALVAGQPIDIAFEGDNFGSPPDLI
jgi:hypothetical protein